MMRNDYRRSLILLRSNAAGYSGHVRLERRTLMGTMYFLMQTGDACPGLRVALVGRGRSGAYYACAIGETCRDARGQAVLSYGFNPRDICARELEQYQLVAVTRAGDDNCEIVLYGNVCGHAELNWDEVRAALRSLYGGTPTALPDAAPVTELPPQADASATRGADVPGEVSPAADAALPEAASGDDGSQFDAASVEEVAQAATVSDDDDSQSGEVAQVTLISGNDSSQTDASPAEEVTQAMSITGDDGSQFDEAPVGETAQEATVFSNDGLQSDVAVDDSATSGDSLRDEGCAAGTSRTPAAWERLAAQGVSINQPWPEEAEPLRELFRNQIALDDAPDGDCVYIAAPMPEGCGYPYAAAGLRAAGGRLISLRYALPSVWTHYPPAGLENYIWVGDRNRGWWRIELPLDG